MIKNQWYAVLDSKQVRKGQLTGVKRMGERLVFWRDTKGGLSCLKDQCCHRGAALSAGKVCSDTLECPFHGFGYGINGQVTKIPANGLNTPVAERYSVNSYIVKEEGGLIWLWWGDKKENLPDIPMFEELKTFKYSQIIDDWDVHYSRCIENQLDAVHLPFVHHNTIGAGGKTLVNGPAVTWDEETMTIYVNNVADDGKTPPQKPNEMGDLNKLFKLKFRFPNIWQNIIAEKVRVFAAFVPIDEEHSVIYLRFYQKVLKVPPLSGVINFFGKIFSNVILKQDKRVVITQMPKKSEYKMGEKLIQGDLPIAEYRRRRDELIKSAEMFK